MDRRDNIPTIKGINKVISKQEKIDKVIYNLFDYHYGKYKEIPTLEEIKKIKKSRKIQDENNEYEIYKKGLFWISQIGYDLALSEWRYERRTK